MSILIDHQTRVVVQGITGQEGSFHTPQMIQYGTSVVAGVTPGKGQTTFKDEVPICDTVEESVQTYRANASVIFVPAPFAADAVMEAAHAGIQLIVCITEGIPVLDMLKVTDYTKKHGVRLIGPNCPGIITPDECKIGIMPGFIHKKGNVGVISRSGTLTYEAVYQMTQIGIGQSTVVGIGGDPVIGTTFIDLLRLFEADEDTNAVVLIGEIGGAAEEKAAAYIADHMSKPVISFIAGRTAPPGRRMGHAGAIISGGKGTASDKMASLARAGVHLVENPSEIGTMVEHVLSKQ
ncbi:MAG: succinate--CoA ligase subunit alpha [candidate division KSB1 bacterium]|nr:succinate--CoA ligase subunit alpha [candidate division KSB1 bacterium]